MKNIYRVVVIGSDRSISILRRLSTDLAQEGCDLIATSSFSLGDHFAIMMIMSGELSAKEVHEVLKPTTDENNLRIMVDAIEDFDGSQDQPDVSVQIHGTDKIGVFAYFMAILNDAGLEIINLHSDLGDTEMGKEGEFMNIIEGRAKLGMDELNRAADNLRKNQIDVTITPMGRSEG